MRMTTEKDESLIVAFGEHGVKLQTLDEAMSFATALAQSGDMCPKHFQNKPQAVLAAIQRGAEIGLGPMQALDSIYVINGRASLSGATCLALMGRPDVMEKGKRTRAGFRRLADGTVEGYCWSWRMGDDESIETTYSAERAKSMGLWNKAGTLWVKDPGTMLKWRAVGEHSRNFYSDVMKGLYLAEEVRDFTQDWRHARDVTPDAARIEGPGDPLLENLEPSQTIVEPGAPDSPEEPERDPETGEIIPDYVGKG